MPELERLAGTIEAWRPEVLGFLQTGVTNAATEATNRESPRVSVNGQPLVERHGLIGIRASA